MLVRLFLLIVIVLFFCYLALANPMDVDFHFFGKVISTELSILMGLSFALGAILVIIGWLVRDVKRAFEGYQESRQKKKGELLKEELNKGIEDFIKGNLTKARAHFTEVLKKDPSQIDLYFRLSDISVKEGNEDEALNWLERARLIDIGNIEILLREAGLYQQMKRFDEAIHILNRAIGMDEANLKALRGLRDLYVDSQRWEEAIRVQKSILKLIKDKQTEEEEGLFFLGLKYQHAKDLLERGGEENLDIALKEAKEIVRERKTFQPGFVLLGDIYLRSGKWAPAGKVWGKSFSRFKSIIFILRLEELYLGREDPSTLLRIYQRVLRHNPDNWILSFFYAKLCLRLEMLDEALEEIDEISLKRKDFAALHRLLAEIYLHKKDFSRAAREFEKTFELSGTTYLPFHCTACEQESKEWIAFCPQCHQWSTYEIREGEKRGPLSPSSLSGQARYSLGV
jgi:lipopolysaccharide biosynthesis regulator YciM